MPILAHTYRGWVV